MLKSVRKSSIEDKVIVALFVATKNRLVDAHPDSYEDYLDLRGQLKAYKRMLIEMGYTDRDMTLLTHEIRFPKPARELAVELCKRFIEQGKLPNNVTHHEIAVEALELEPEIIITWSYLEVLRTEMLNTKTTELE